MWTEISLAAAQLCPLSPWLPGQSRCRQASDCGVGNTEPRHRIQKLFTLTLSLRAPNGTALLGSPILPCQGSLCGGEQPGDTDMKTRSQRVNQELSQPRFPAGLQCQTTGSCPRWFAHPCGLTEREFFGAGSSVLAVLSRALLLTWNLRSCRVCNTSDPLTKEGKFPFTQPWRTGSPHQG